MARRDADPRVAHSQDRLVAVGFHGQLDPPPLSRILGAVDQQVRHDLNQPEQVAFHLGRLLGERDSQVHFPRVDERTTALDGPRHHIRQVHSLLLEVDLTLADPGDVEQVIHQPGDLLDLMLDH